MARKSLIITIVAHLPYIKPDSEIPEFRANDALVGDSASASKIQNGILVEQELLFSAISETYLPLLKMFRRLDADGIPFNVVMVFSPTLCALLADPVVQVQYEDWLDRLITFGRAELSRYAPGSTEYRLAERHLETALENRRMFVDEFKRHILDEFRFYSETGKIELMATCATFAFLPHYADMNEVVHAQVEVGLASHKEYFHLAPDGFWLPRMGYTPGIEKILRAYGLNYTVLETHGILFARPIPDYGIFAPVRCGDSLVAFARDQYSHAQVLGKDGFIANPVYRNQNRDAAFEEEAQNLECLFPLGNEARITSGYRYWAKNDSLYDMDLSLAQAKKDAREFFAEKQSRLEKAVGCSDLEDALLMCSFNANVFGGIWHEGIAWLEEIFRAASEGGAVQTSACLRLLDNQASLQKIEPYPSACSGAGYGEDLLDNSNAYLIRYVRKASERMLELAERFFDHHGLKMRTLNLAAKETLLAQSSDWPRMLSRRSFAEYADERFKEFILAVSTVFDSLGANSISTEWLTKYERKHPIFPDLNYRVFSKKRTDFQDKITLRTNLL